MAEMLDCLVNYFSDDLREEEMPRRYVCYHVVGGPGPTESGGVACVAILAANDYALCESCDRFHAVSAGGPKAAIERALRYLDVFHQEDNLRKVQTELRCYSCQDPTPSHPSGDDPPVETPAVPRIEPTALVAHLESGRPATVLDGRSADAWNSSHLRIRGDIRVDRDRLRVEPSWPKHQFTVVYCTCPHDAGAAQIADWLRGQGFTDVYALRGGFESWQAASGPVSSK